MSKTVFVKRTIFTQDEFTKALFPVYSDRDEIVHVSYDYFKKEVVVETKEKGGENNG